MAARDVSNVTNCQLTRALWMSRCFGLSWHNSTTSWFIKCSHTLVGPAESIPSPHVAARAMNTELNRKLPTFPDTEAKRLKLRAGAAMLVTSGQRGDVGARYRRHAATTCNCNDRYRVKLWRRRVMLFYSVEIVTKLIKYKIIIIKTSII